MTTYEAVQMVLDIFLETGMHIGTGFGLAQLVDERITRGPHAQPTYAVDLPYIPGASLKGRLRAHAEHLSTTLELPDRTQLCQDLFGTVRHAGRLIFPDAYLAEHDERMLTQSRDDLWSQEEQPGALAPGLTVEERSHVALSRERRSAREKMLMRIEVASPGLSFTSIIRGWLPTEHARRELALLVLAARSITHLGGHKGRGLGAVRVTPTQITQGTQTLTHSDVMEAL